MPQRKSLYRTASSMSLSGKAVVGRCLNNEQEKHLDENFSHFLKFDPYSRTPDSFISTIQHQFQSTVPFTNTCVNTVGDTILMVVEPWFSPKGKDFRAGKR